MNAQHLQLHVAHHEIYTKKTVLFIGKNRQRSCIANFEATLSMRSSNASTRRHQCTLSVRFFPFSEATPITKTASPGVIIVTNGGTGLAQFNILSANFPSGTLSKTKTLLGIDWQTTLYPNNPGETVQLCYYRPYSSTEVGCTTILRNSSGTVSNFNTQPFGPGAKVIIRHFANGGPQPAYPAGQDTVTFRYSY